MLVYGWPFIVFIVVSLVAQVAWGRHKAKRRAMRREAWSTGPTTRSRC